MGFGGFKILKDRKRAPSLAAQVERALRVEAIAATFKKEANSSADRLAQVQQVMPRAEIKLERCKVVAPFTCRYS